MEQRIQAKRPRGLNEINDQIENLVEVKARIESGEVEMPDTVQSEIEGSIIRLVSERMKLENQLNC